MKQVIWKSQIRTATTLPNNFNIGNNPIFIQKHIGSNRFIHRNSNFFIQIINFNNRQHIYIYRRRFKSAFQRLDLFVFKIHKSGPHFSLITAVCYAKKVGILNEKRRKTCSVNPIFFISYS